MSDGHFVDDINDPGGQGMFSKAGRYKTEQNIIFQRKDEILHGKKTIRPSQSMPSFQTIKKIPETVNKAGAKVEEDKDAKNNHLKEKTPFYKQLSREYVFNVKNPKPVSKPVGTYQPSYKQIDPNPKLLWDTKSIINNLSVRKETPLIDPHRYTEQEWREKFPMSKKFVPPMDTTEEERQRPIPEKVHAHIHGIPDFQNTTSRPDVVKFQKDNPHPSRFLPFKCTTSWSNIPRVPSFEFSKRIGREIGGVYKEKEHQPDYNPNYEYSKKQFHNTGPNFSSRPSRKPLLWKTATNYEDFYNFDFYVRQKNKSHIFQTQKTFYFDKQLPREINPNSPLPSFMQKHVNQRANLTQLHHKMLEQNHFFEGRFQSTGSDFMKSQDKFKKKDKDAEDEDESIDLEGN